MKWIFLLTVGALAVMAVAVLTYGAYLEEEEDCDEDRHLGT